MEQRIGPAQRIPPPRVEVPEEIVTNDEPGMDEALQRTAPVPMAKYHADIPISRLSRTGLTLDSYIIVDGQSISLRQLWEAGIVTPRDYRRSDGYVFEALFVDRVRSVIITHETFEAMRGVRVDDTDAQPGLTAVEQIAVDASAMPDRLEAIKMIEHGPWENEVERNDRN